MASGSSSTQSTSKRWTHFHSALQLAIQRSAHKWTYEDFTECFALWCEEQSENASSVFIENSRFMEEVMTKKCDELLESFEVEQNLNKLHAVVTEARARKQTGYDGKDLWNENLHPGAAVRARTIPLLEAEKKRLQAELEKIDGNNQKLQVEMQKNVKERQKVDRETTQLLDILDEVHQKWNELPMEDIQAWSLQTAESTINGRPLA